jgi:hypothetical protein
VVHQVPPDAVKSSFEPVAELSRHARDALDEVGVVFAEETQFDEAGPTQWAVVAIDDERQYLVVHHYAHPEGFVELRASVEETSVERATAAFLDAVGLAETDVLSRLIALPEHWQPSSDRRILTWVAALTALTATAVWIRRARTP